MKIHEYQAKQLLSTYGIPIQRGFTVDDPAQIPATLDKVTTELHANSWVVKAQIHAGGRGKGGGVIFSPHRDKTILHAEKVLGMTLVTPQTGASGQLVKTIMIAEGIDIVQEYYVAITLDRRSAQPVFIVSQAGGVDIEEIAATQPEKITSLPLPKGGPLRSYHLRELAIALGFTDPALFKAAAKIFSALYQLYCEKDASIVEINPLVRTTKNTLLALDAKINFDDNALYRHPNLAALHDPTQEDASEQQARHYNLNFIKLSGNVGCMVNGAGLAMATMDIIKLKGGDPANFLDVGGTANPESVKNAFKIITADPNVKAILINIFGGIVRCDRVANGVVAAAKELNLKIPVVVRLAGTNVDLANEIIQKSGIAVIAAPSLEEAASKVVALV